MQRARLLALLALLALCLSLCLAKEETMKVEVPLPKVFIPLNATVSSGVSSPAASPPLLAAALGVLAALLPHLR